MNKMLYGTIHGRICIKRFIEIDDITIIADHPTITCSDAINKMMCMPILACVISSVEAAV